MLRRHPSQFVKIGVVFFLILAVILAPQLHQVAAQSEDNPDGVIQLTGSVKVTSRFVLEDTASLSWPCLISRRSSTWMRP